MDSRTIGSLDVSVAGLGCNDLGGRLDPAASDTVVRAAIDVGIRFFDTAEMYGAYAGASEEVLGNALAGVREDVVIATKFGYPSVDGRQPLDRGSIRGSLTASLKRLRRDAIDLYQLHRPRPETPMVEILGTLQELTDEGLVREVGCSGFSAEQLDEAQVAATTNGLRGFGCVQNRYSLLSREVEHNGVLERCERYGLKFLPYFPLESGVLTGRYPKRQPLDGRIADMPIEKQRRFLNDRNLRAVGRLTAWANAHDHSLLDLALSYLASQPQIASVIAGATNEYQVRSNARAVAWKLSKAQIDEVRVVAADR